MKQKISNKSQVLATALLFLSVLQLNAHGHDEEHDRDRYEYNLYDRNYDEIRGRNVYEQEDRAYPEQQYYPNPDHPQTDFYRPKSKER